VNVRTAALVSLFVWCCSAAALGQTRDPHAVQPERPTVATHAGTVAPGWIEMEWGAEWDRYADRSRGVAVPVVVKIGLSPRTQLNVLQTPAKPSGGDSVHPGDLTVGVKWRLTDDAPAIGRFAILPSIKFPTGSAEAGTGTGTTDVGLIVISSHDVGSMAIDLNAGYTRRGGDGLAAPRHATVWTASFGGPALGSVGWVAELYGFPRTAGPAGQDNLVAILAGPTFSVRPWLGLDVGIIAPLAGPQPRAVYVGGVWNIGRLWTDQR
jgi:outer membrane putative beta-barrel porin/alpha-amylase